MTVRLGELVEALEQLYPPSWAQDWDAVGLVCGDPASQVRRVLLAVDPVEAVVTEAVEGGFDLLVTHHPLWLHGTTSVAATTPKGRVVHRLLAAGAGLFVAHTNADVANPGVSDALAALFDLQDLRPLEPVPGAPHRGLGRVGELPVSLPLGTLTALAAQVLPPTAWGVRASGDPDRLVRTLAVCGGSGDSLLAAAAVADAYLTADLRHHPASEAPDGLALIDAAHWATEWPWLADVAQRLSATTTVVTVVSALVTDPWTHAVRSTLL